jgi:hypothetical protein
MTVQLYHLTSISDSQGKVKTIPINMIDCNALIKNYKPSIVYVQIKVRPNNFVWGIFDNEITVD